MGHHFAKFQGVENVWEKIVMASVIWESYGEKLPIVVS